MTVDADAYAVLQVRGEAEQVVIQAAYRALAKRYHPDGECPAPERMQALNAAYERVRTPERRARYDADRARQRVAVGPGPAQTPAPPYDPWANRAGGEPVGKPESEVIDFGRYAGWRIRDLARHDPDYLRWLSRHSTGVRYLDVIARHLPGEGLGRRTSVVR